MFACELDDRLLRFGDLRMPPPDARNRGRLVSAEAETRYMSLLVEQNITVSFSVMTAISKVVTQANASEDAPPPKGHHFATTHDGFDHAHRALAPVDIPSDGEFHTIPVEASEGPSRRKFLAVPRETQDVFRVVEFDNPSQAPLLRGPADIYVGEDYLMTSNLDVTPSGGVVSLGLGVEQAIKISRNTSYREETAGLIRGSLVLHHEIDVSLTNHLDDDADVEVTERVPVARDGDDNVKVNIDSVEPSWSAYERKDRPAPGVYRWKVSVPAGGRQALSARYSIRVPAALELAGGNRREG